MVQVIPTVGVEGDESDKKRLAMLKHFSRLVDPSAKKAKFLSAFQKRPRSETLEEQATTADSSVKEAINGDGSMKGAPSGTDIKVKAELVEQTAAADIAIKQASIAAGGSSKRPLSGADVKAEANSIKEEDNRQTGSGCFHDSTEHAPRQERDLSLADIKAEGDTGQPKIKKHGDAPAEQVKGVDISGEGKEPGSDVDISSSDGDVKSEELQAAEEELADCLQEDSHTGKKSALLLSALDTARLSFS